jgi:hypothetical protein
VDMVMDAIARLINEAPVRTPMDEAHVG